MQIKITYPSISRGSGSRRRMLSVLRWPFIIAAITSVAVDICVDGPVWSPVAVFALYMAWSLIFSLDLVEYNIISQSIKTIVFTSILLTLIDIFIISGWAKFVVPIVCFGGLVVCTVLFLAGLETHKHNMLPFVLFIVAALFGSAIGLTLWHEENYWPFIALGVASVIDLVMLIIVLGQDFMREMKRRLHIK